MEIYTLKTDNGEKSLTILKRTVSRRKAQYHPDGGERQAIRRKKYAGRKGRGPVGNFGSADAKIGTY